MSEKSREWKTQVGFSDQCRKLSRSTSVPRDTERLAILQFRSGPSLELDHADHELLSPRTIRNKVPWFTGISSDSILPWHPMLT